MCIWHNCNESGRTFSITKAEYKRSGDVYPLGRGVERSYCDEHKKEAKSLGFEVLSTN